VKEVMAHQVEVNIRGIFNNRFLKESFSLSLAQEMPLSAILERIDQRLRTRFLTGSDKELPAGWIILLNGERISLADKDSIVLRDKDQLSILSALGGG